jgi:hypothetical protein
VYRFLADVADVGAVLADGAAVREEEEVRVVLDEVVAFRASTAGATACEQLRRERGKG